MVPSECVTAITILVAMSVMYNTTLLSAFHLLYISSRISEMFFAV
jgi:hypothetical protein